MPDPILSAQWVEFVKRCEHVIRSRPQGSPVVMMVPWYAGPDEGYCHLLTYDMRREHYLLCIYELSHKLAKEAPDMKEAQRLMRALNRIFGLDGGSTDITKGMN